MRNDIVLAGVVVMGLVLAARWAAGATIPVVHEPVTAVVKSGAAFVPVSITGWGLGPETGSEVDVISSLGTTTLGASHADIVLWNDRQVVVKISPSLTNLSVRVRHPGGESMAFPVEFFRYDSFGAAAPASLPVDLVVDAASRVWIIAQFHDSLRYWDPADATVHTVAIPHAAGAGAFTSFGLRTWNSPVGEDIALDSHGRLWWAQGGGVHATLPAFSRVVSYDPAEDEPDRFRIWNVPGNQSWATHVVWDAYRSRMWFSRLPRTLCNNEAGGAGIACATAQPARLVAFYPDDHGGALPHDNAFDFNAATSAATCTGFSQNAYPTPPTAGTCAGVTPTRACFTAADCVLANKVCGPPPVDETTCFREYDVPSSMGPRGMVVDVDGNLWFASTLATSGFGYLGRLDPTTGTITRFPFRESDVPSADPAANASGVQPVEVAMGPNGDIVVAEGNASRVTRLRKAGLNTALFEFICPLLLGPGDSNICMTELLSPNYCDRTAGTCVLGAGSGSGIVDKRVRDVAVDFFGNTWFTQRGRTTGAPSTSLGLVRPGWGRIALLPPLSLFGGAAFQGGGIDVDPVTNAVWFAESDRREVGRIHPLPVAFGPATALRRTGLSTVPISVTGTGFGPPAAGSEIVVQSGASALNIPATDASVVLWSDRQIVIEVSESLTNATVSVTTPAGSSAAVSTEYYQYDVFSTSLTAAGLALDPAIDTASGRVWVLDEFHRHLKFWNPGSEEVELIPDAVPSGQTFPDLIPHALTTGAFSVSFQCRPAPGSLCTCPIGNPNHVCEARSWVSTWGEDVLIDGTGRAWFGQGGITATGLPNHGRIVSYDPNLAVGSRFKIWNIPGNDVGAPFVVWDEDSDRLWFTTKRRETCNSGGLFDPRKCTTIAPPRLMSFRPDAGYFPHDNRFDFEAAAADPDNECVGFSQETYPDAPIAGACATSGQPCIDDRDCILLETLCGTGLTDDYCFQAYDLDDPNDFADDPYLKDLAHIELDDGAIWSTTYLRSAKIGRFDLGTGEQVWYPSRPAESPGIGFSLGVAQWELRVSDRHPVYSEYGASRLSRLDGDQFDNAACQSLVSLHAPTDCETLPDATCDNPCITQMLPPNICVGSCASWSFDGGFRVKSVARGLDSRVWFTETADASNSAGVEALGFLETSSSTRMIMLPPIALVSDPGEPHRGAGIDIDPMTGQIWVTDVIRSELMRLTPLAP
ncbi:MAG: hypothetical protein KIT14_01655 [bacterium]|nr:hypothetical protein [bacterium]